MDLWLATILMDATACSNAGEFEDSSFFSNKLTGPSSVSEFENQKIGEFYVLQERFWSSRVVKGSVGKLTGLVCGNWRYNKKLSDWVRQREREREKKTDWNCLTLPIKTHRASRDDWDWLTDWLTYRFPKYGLLLLTTTATRFKLLGRVAFGRHAHAASVYFYPCFFMLAVSLGP